MVRKPDYWGLTPPELHYLTEAAKQREEALQRSYLIGIGTVAAEVRNTLRGSKNDRVWTWRDFVKDEKKHMTVAQAKEFMAAWMQTRNGA